MWASDLASASGGGAASGGTVPFRGCHSDVALSGRNQERAGSSLAFPVEVHQKQELLVLQIGRA